MALEEKIVEWSTTRPAWQRWVLRRVAAGNVLSDADFDQLVADVVTPRTGQKVIFSLEQFPQTTAEDPPVRLLSIGKSEHVNALESNQLLTFEPNGLTIVYGDNGSGKSGYARLLKRITRARHREEVLSDVFLDTALVKPTARLSVQIGDEDKALDWPDSTSPELQRMLFYDEACGGAYITTESDFPYRPSALFVMDGLIEACVAVRSRIDVKLEENSRSATAIPVIEEGVNKTDAGQFLSGLSGQSSLDVLGALIHKFDESSDTIDGLKDREALLRSADTSKERQRLAREAEKAEALCTHLKGVHTVLGNDGLAAIQERRERFNTLQKAAKLVAQSFESEPLSGIGTSPWKALWESARRFSKEHAYPSKPFPVVDGEARCVLCQQALEGDGRNRLSRFEQFVKDDTQVQLEQARRECDGTIEGLKRMHISPEAVANNLRDLESVHEELIAEVRALLTKYENALAKTLKALPGTGSLQLFGIELATILSRLTEAAKAARNVAEGLSDPEVVRQRLAATTKRRQELELLRRIKQSRDAIVKEIVRLGERELLEVGKTTAATGPITKKILELSEESITEVVRNAFIRETDRLHLDHVTIARARAEKGALLHQPKLVGARQKVKLPRVFSEGEQTALGLAAFFTEVQLDASRSALVLDDPVSSLDHVRRGLVANRLAVFSETRQVVMFTHDVSFVADLKREANGRGVPIAERSVMRSRADARKPGKCGTQHPWKAKDVKERLGELRDELARIKKESTTWEEKTYDNAVATWAGNLSETWERIFSQEIVGQILAEGGLEVRPMMVRILTRFSDGDYEEFQASYSRVSQWAKRHDKSAMVNYIDPEVDMLENELKLVETWFNRVKKYKNS